MKKRVRFPLFFMLLAMPALMGCGEMTRDRTDSGTLNGSSGGNPLTNTLIGGPAGGAGNPANNPAQVNLGEPVWK